MRVWRHISSFFLLTLLAAPLLFLFFLQLKQVHIKHTLEERLEAGLLKTIVVPQQEFQPVSNIEILVDGKLFDIKSARQIKSGVEITGVFDDEETEVLQQLDKACNQQTSKDTSLAAQAFQLLHGFFFQATEESPLLVVAVNQLFQKPIPFLPILYKQVLSPPPQPLT